MTPDSNSPDVVALKTRLAAALGALGNACDSVDAVAPLIEVRAGGDATAVAAGFAALKDELSAALQEIARAEGDVDTMRAWLDDIQSGSDSLVARLRKVQEEGRAQAELAEVAGTRLATREIELEEERRRADEISGQLMDARAATERLGAAKDDVERRLVELQAQQAEALAAKDTDIASLRATLEQLRGEIAERASDLEKAQAEFAEARRAQDESAAATARAEAASAAMRQDHERALEALRAESEAASAARAAESAKIAALQRDLRIEREQGFAGRSELAHWREVAQINETAIDDMKRQAGIVGVRQRVDRAIEAASREMRRNTTFLSAMSVALSQLRWQGPQAAPRRALGWSEARAFRGRMQFDRAWYLSQNPDVAAAGIDPLKHYLEHGVVEDRDPNPYFSAVWYRAHAPEPLGDVPAYPHFLADPARRAWSRHPLFDEAYYRARHPELKLKPQDAFDDFIAAPGQSRRDPHPLLDFEHLRAQSQMRDSSDPFLDYLTRPDLFTVNPNPVFDARFYLTENPDVRAGRIHPLLHYHVVGWRQGRRPHPLFEGDWYLSQNADVSGATVDPLAHYLSFGAQEGRKPHPLFDVDYYVERAAQARWKGEPLTRGTAFLHYLETAAGRDVETTRDISAAEMREALPEATAHEIDPINGFMEYANLVVGVPAYVMTSPAAKGEAMRFSWPPAPRKPYWLPQSLRDYIVERYGEAFVALYLYLMAAVSRYGDDPDGFVASDELRVLRHRMELLASEKYAGDDVEVSVVIPVYNNLVYTLTCVISLLEQATRRRYEIIIGDDLSSDATPQVFDGRDSAVRLVRHDVNLGFLGNCNTCAAGARGRYVVMLNNDTLVLPGWLDELIAPFEADPRIGFTGSKLLNADGTLQEAGGIFWKDGSAWNFGRNGDPRRPEFNYLKDVDYVSGASIAMPRDLWETLGGFDPTFSPAYCEDADIAFRTRAAGRRTVYAPHSELIHHEGRSHGRDVASGVKAYQVANMKKLRERWGDTYAKEHFANGEDVFLARDRTGGKKHALIVDHYVPQWDRDAGSRSIFHIIRMFVDRGWQVIFWPDNLNEDREYVGKLQDMGVEVIYSAAYVNQFRRFMADNGKHIDCVVLSRPHIALHYYKAVRAYSKAPILYYGIDIHYLRMEQEYATNPTDELAQAIADMRDLEYDNWAQADVIVYPSHEESTFVQALSPEAKADHIPVYAYTPKEREVGVRNLAAFDRREIDELVFVGGSHPPNVDAVMWFTRDVFPLILQRRPTTRLNIVGSSVSDDVRRLASESIKILGRVSDEDLEKLYARVGAVVVPLRFGGGVKGKVIDALFNAAPLITTSVGLQGLAPAQPICFEAAGAPDFADAVLRALEDREEARRRAAAGLEFIAQNYSEEALLRTFARYTPGLAPEENGAGSSSEDAALSDAEAAHAR